MNKQKEGEIRQRVYVETNVNQMASALETIRHLQGDNAVLRAIIEEMGGMPEYDDVKRGVVPPPKPEDIPKDDCGSKFMEAIAAREAAKPVEKPAK